MATKKELLEQSQKAIGDYFSLSKYLFGEESPAEINDIPEESPFYKDARALAKEMELDWDNITHEDGNRILLNLLSEYFYRIDVDNKYKPVLTISFQKAE